MLSEPRSGRLFERRWRERSFGTIAHAVSGGRDGGCPDPDHHRLPDAGTSTGRDARPNVDAVANCHGYTATHADLGSDSHQHRDAEPIADEHARSRSH